MDNKDQEIHRFIYLTQWKNHTGSRKLNSDDENEHKLLYRLYKGHEVFRNQADLALALHDLKAIHAGDEFLHIICTNPYSPHTDLSRSVKAITQMTRDFPDLPAKATSYLVINIIIADLFPEDSSFYTNASEMATTSPQSIVKTLQGFIDSDYIDDSSPMAAIKNMSIVHAEGIRKGRSSTLYGLAITALKDLEEYGYLNKFRDLEADVLNLSTEESTRRLRYAPTELFKAIVINHSEDLHNKIREIKREQKDV